MQLAGLILFIGFFTLFLIWGYRLLSIRKILYLVPKEELISQYSIGIALFIVVAISAGMAWG